MIFCRNIFVSQHQKKFSGVPFSVSETFWYRKNLWTRGGWNVTIYRQKCFGHMAEKNCTGILQCFTDFRYRKILCIGGESHDFLSKIFCPTVPKNLAGEPFCVSDVFRYRRKLLIRKVSWVEYHEIPSEMFCLTLSKKCR